MKDLTSAVPKPMLKVAGKTLLEYKFENLPYDVDEIILVVGYLGSMIHDHFGGMYRDKRILYIEQDELNGTAGALWCAQSVLRDRFLVMMGDDLYAKEDADRCIAINGWTMLVEQTEHMRAGGRIIVDENETIVAIEEGDHHGEPGLMNTNMFALDPRIFDFPMVPKAAGSSEYGLPQTVLAAAKQGNIPFSAVKSTFWFQITDPEDLKKVPQFLAVEAAAA